MTSEEEHFVRLVDDFMGRPFHSTRESIIAEYQSLQQRLASAERKIVKNGVAYAAKLATAHKAHERDAAIINELRQRLEVARARATD